MAANPRSIRDATKALHAHFAAPNVPPSLPAERRRTLQAFIDEYDDSVDEEDARRVNQELKHFWHKYVSGSPRKSGAFVGVLRELRPAIVEEDDILEWYEAVVKPCLTALDTEKTALDDACEFLAGVMIYDETADNAQERARTSARIYGDLLDVYLARTRGITPDHQFVAPENSQIAKQVETALIFFGRKMPRPLFHRLDDLIVRAATRLPGLTLLSSFLQVQAPHLYLVTHTPLVDDLLKCLMNDTSTTVLSVALTSLIMLLPHLPSSLKSRLPRLFLIYTRLLCWEKFSPLSTEAQKKLVTDDRISDDEYDRGDVGIDSKWEKCIPSDGILEPATPELMTYFTCLYGIYPLNFMSYIRKPRKYLKLLNFPGADDFDLAQAVIRSRSDQFRQAHILHPNFYNMTPEEELIDPKWPKLDPSDVVAECHGLAINAKPSLLSPGPPPTGKLPEIPPLPPIPSSNNGSISPAISQMSLRSGHSWRDTLSTAVPADPESPILRPNDEHGEGAPRLRSRGSQATTKASPLLDEFPLPGSGFHREKKEPLTNLEYLQQKLTALQTDLNFERWHKAQYSQHISQLMRKNVKDATVEAETLNLINANRALKKELEQARIAREATIKDSNLTRKQANNLETNMQERFNKMKKEQEVWVNDAEELKRLRAEMKHHRDLLSAAEARESNQKHELEIMRRDVDQMRRLQSQLQEAQRKVREYELREFDYEHAKRELEIAQSEKDTLHLRLQRHEQDRERTKRVYTDRIAELEARMGSGGPYDRPSASPSNDTHALRQALADAQSRLAQLKKTHSRLLEKHMDLELEYQSIKSQLEGLQGSAYGTEGLARSGSVLRNSTITSGGISVNRGGVLESVYGIDSEYDAAPEVAAYSRISTSDPTPRRYDSTRDLIANAVPPGSPQRSEAVLHNGAGLTWKPASSAHSVMSSRSGAGGGAFGYNVTVPLRADKRSISSGNSGERREREREKIAANSEVRVYGRGGAQNIKMKPNEKEKDRDKGGSSKAEKQKGGGFKALKGIAGL
ncbi:tuberous sclerosis 1 homolog [Lecanosticta acicola]|uniref:Tuberous sclerosis 1 homolog n=1 Tax=Lecanosticta acicola TaxID=111012 RepID=A0AAI8Z2S7_9PEZI|nr:tuberous sclerosis 1 homolog [Lecanosticta acicola]